MYHCVEDRANTLNSNFILPAVLVPEGQVCKMFSAFQSTDNCNCWGLQWKVQLISKYLIQNFCSIAKDGVQTWGRGPWVPLTAAWAYSGDKARKRTGYSKGATGEREAVGRAVVSDEWSDNRNSITDKLCSNCNTS